MSNPNPLIIKNYPIFKPIISEHCILNTNVKCTISDIKLEVSGIKTIAESYILQYTCSANGMLINTILGFNISPVCYEQKYPLDAFFLSKTGITSNNIEKDLVNFQEEEMPASDLCHFKSLEFLSCGKMVNGFPHTDEMNGYKLIAITDENREDIYAEFKEKGFNYEASQIAINNIMDHYNKENSEKSSIDSSYFDEIRHDLTLKTTTTYDVEEINEIPPVESETPQTWFEYFYWFAPETFNYINSFFYAEIV